MIDLETRLLEIHDWDEEQLQSLYERAANFLNGCKLSDKGSIERELAKHLRGRTTDEGARLIFMVLDQNIRREMRTIEE